MAVAVGVEEKGRRKRGRGSGSSLPFARMGTAVRVWEREEEEATGRARRCARAAPGAKSGYRRKRGRLLDPRRRFAHALCSLRACRVSRARES